MATGELPGRPATPADPSPPATRVRSLTLVIPAKDEAANLANLLAELVPVLAALPGLRSEVLVIDDGSRDATAEIAAAAGARVVRHAESLGNGAAVKRGIREARHEWILLLDGDGQHPPAAIPELIRQAERYDMVVGSRGGTGGAWYRNLANRVYNRLASYVTNRPIPDLTSGFRLIRADAAKGFAYLLPNTFSYPSTITLAMLRGGYSVGFQPIQVRPRGGRSHIRLLRDGSRFVLIILRIATFFAPLRVFLPLSLAFALAGLAWYAYTFFTESRFTNMAGLLLTQATVIFVLGLISEQIAAMRFERGEDRRS
ncbi:MAG: glycosyltransferase family 2 protein [Planctomycetes bacterium]|nr:glycosyltransferase family 2 protein [Planctomycetota bacterium]